MTPLHSDMHSTNIGLKSHDNNDPQLCMENLGRRPRCPPIHAIAGNNQFILEKERIQFNFRAVCGGLSAVIGSWWQMPIIFCSLDGLVRGT